MAFLAGNTNAKKEFYKIFLCLLNESSATVTTAFNTLKSYLRLFVNSIKETYGTGASVAMSNATNDLLIINDPTTTAVTVTGITDGKLRYVANLKASGAVTVGGTSVPVGNGIFVKGSTVVTTVSPFFPVGLCLAEPTITNEKGEDIKISDGNTLVLSNNVNVNFVLANICDDLQISINTFQKIGVMFVATKSNKNIYLDNNTPFVSLQIKGNALGQTTFSVEKESNLLNEAIIEG